MGKIRDTLAPNSFRDHYDIELVTFVEKNLGDLPHFFFHGNPGTGKTQFAHLIAKELLGHSIGLNFYEFNSSDDRGIEFVRNQLKDISRSSSPISGRKIILLDEADGLTKDAQNSLRRIMETGNALWILTANDPTKIIEALKNRCHCVEFKGPDSAWLERRAVTVLDAKDYVTFQQAIKISPANFRKIFQNCDVLESGGNPIGPETKLLSMTTKDFVAYSWNADVSVTVKKMHEEILGLESKKKANALVILAEMDYRCSLMTQKALQLQVGFIQIRKALSEK